mmetsp:Transcript_15208/g.39305  ORF Transcript_15208/g.39305 Transcript_15208/m.39305 type:complete len:632 (-) Transcript_15208:94-1989(-)
MSRRLLASVASQTLSHLSRPATAAAICCVGTVGWSAAAWAKERAQGVDLGRRLHSTWGRDGIMGFGQVQTALNFFTYGRGEFTKTGYEKHAKKYAEPAFHDSVDLAGKTYMVTGANSGIGKEISTYLASKGATLYMVCRSPERGETARTAVADAAGSKDVHLLLADCGLEADVRSMWAKFTAHQSDAYQRDTPQLDGLVCNAGALLNERTLNKDGVETTFAAHLAIGSYLLGRLALPVMEATPGSRIVLVTSGGAYNERFPGWETITSTAPDSVANYNGNIAYAWAKRGQILLAEQWAAAHPDVKVVTTHPGWAATEGVDASLADTKHLLEPMRSAWQGAEGMCWLLAVDAEAIKSGALYLDRQPQSKHLAGWFWTEGSRTKNSADEVAMMMVNLERFVAAEGPMKEVWRPTPERTQAKLEARASAKSLTASPGPLDLQRFMGKWNVLANAPIFAMGEQNLYNPVENYEWDEANKRVQVVYKFYRMGSTELGEARQHGYVKKDDSGGTTWALHPKLGIYLPLNLGYLVLHTAPDYSWTLIGVPDRKFLWIMTRARPTAKDPAPYPVDADPEKVKASRAAGLAPVDALESETVLTLDEEAAILREAMLKAEAAGYDISQVRMAGWYPEVPYP